MTNKYCYHLNIDLRVPDNKGYNWLLDLIELHELALLISAYKVTSLERYE